MRIAYLIIVHNEFEILRRLVDSLDEEGIDIYIHYDKKVRVLPIIETKKSILYILKKRIDVRWGHVSQIACEYLLWEEAVKNGPYDYYNLISGVHLPLKSRTEINNFFVDKKGMNILPFFKIESGKQRRLKMCRYNLFLRHYAYGPKWFQHFSQILWRLSNTIQEIFGIGHYLGEEFCFSSNWVCLSQSGIEYMLRIKDMVLRKYKYTFCGDEWFVATELYHSQLRDTIYSSPELVKYRMGNANAKAYSIEDYQFLINSGCLFGRKFSEADMVIVDKILSING